MSIRVAAKLGVSIPAPFPTRYPYGLRMPAPGESPKDYLYSNDSLLIMQPTANECIFLPDGRIETRECLSPERVFGEFLFLPIDGSMNRWKFAPVRVVVAVGSTCWA